MYNTYSPARGRCRCHPPVMLRTTRTRLKIGDALLLTSAVAVLYRTLSTDMMSEIDGPCLATRLQLKVQLMWSSCEEQLLRLFEVRDSAECEV